MIEPRGPILHSSTDPLQCGYLAFVSVIWRFKVLLTRDLPDVVIRSWRCRLRLLLGRGRLEYTAVRAKGQTLMISWNLCYSLFLIKSPGTLSVAYVRNENINYYTSASRQWHNNLFSGLYDNCLHSAFFTKFGCRFVGPSLEVKLLPLVSFLTLLKRVVFL